jgi:tRNA uridine 5-carboxymethylaminomethyl modification enzyme
MFTSRAEYRILLRQDNADLRLTPIAHRLGVQGTDLRMDRVRAKNQAVSKSKPFSAMPTSIPEEMNGYLQSVDSAPIGQKMKLHNILLRPQADIAGMAAFARTGQLSRALRTGIREMAEIGIKYEGYIKKEEEMVAKTAPGRTAPKILTTAIKSSG